MDPLQVKALLEHRGRFTNEDEYYEFYGRDGLHSLKQLWHWLSRYKFKNQSVSVYGAMNMNQKLTIEHSEIVDVITRETDCFINADFACWVTCWVQSEQTRAVCISSTIGSTVLEGWQSIESYYKEVFASGHTCKTTDFQRTRFSISVDKDMAIVTFDGRSVQMDNTVEKTFETRVLQREQGQWRILYSSFLMRGHQRDDAGHIAIDGNGVVLCASEAALASMEEHGALRVLRGRLRAIKPDWDEVLQSGIQCAAQQHRYFQHYSYSTQHQRSFRLPIAFGEFDHGGVAFCTLFVRDEMTFVELPSQRDMEYRLNIAKAIFSLSEGQQLLVQRIVRGESLVLAAEALGISINSVRTQLSRIYIKTGVNSQTALVRTLLSVR